MRNITKDVRALLPQYERILSNGNIAVFKIGRPIPMVLERKQKFCKTESNFRYLHKANCSSSLSFLLQGPHLMIIEVWYDSGYYQGKDGANKLA